MPRVFLHVPPIGIGPDDNFYYDGTRPAQHCSICGDSFQPWLARTSEYLTDGEVQLAVQLELDEWKRGHNKRHSDAEHLRLRESGNLMTPTAALKLIPLGIYPIGDLVTDEEVAQAGLEAARAPSDDVQDHLDRL
jgi:hypothetical protein